MTFVIAPPCRRRWTGTALASTSPLVCPCSRHGWATATRRRPTTTCGPPRSCWRSPPSASPISEHGHERTGSDDTGVLYRTPAGPAPGQPEHDRRLPRHVPAAARVRRAADRQDAQPAPGRRSRRRADRRVPGSSRARARQQHLHAQRAAGGGPLVVQLRRAQAPRSTPTRSHACSRSRPNAAQSRSSRS